MPNFGAGAGKGWPTVGRSGLPTGVVIRAQRLVRGGTQRCPVEAVRHRELTTLPGLAARVADYAVFIDF
jgi:hypothetical protein